jgi:hypothetical protein
LIHFKAYDNSNDPTASRSSATFSGQLLLAAGQQDQARTVLEISLAAAEKIGATETSESLRQLINRTQQA